MDINLGTTAITPGALEQLDHVDIPPALRRHASGDWGDVCPDDWAANNDAALHGGRLLSQFRDCRGTRFWIITEADRSVTTVLLPHEY